MSRATTSSPRDRPGDPGGPIRWFISGDDAAIDELELSEDEVIELLALAGDPGISEQLISQDRPNVRASGAQRAHPARLLVWAYARHLQYDDSAPDVAADFLEALDALMAGDHHDWTGVAASMWCHFLIHQSEAGSAWPAAQALLQRYPDAATPPRMLASFAMIGERAGDLDTAHGFWERARLHPDLVGFARSRWTVEYDWARGHLMLSGAAPARAVEVLRRVCAGMSSFTDVPGRMLFVEATLEHAFAMVLIGRCAEAVDALRSTTDVIGNDPEEFAIWMRALQSLPLALLGRCDEAREALAETARARTDTSSLELAVTIPARVIVAGHDGDAEALTAAIGDARKLERARAVDVEVAIIWRMFAVLGALAFGNPQHDASLIDELAAHVESAERALPTHVAHGSLLLALAKRDRDASESARSRLDDLGITTGSGEGDPWGVLVRGEARRTSRDRTPTTGAVRLEVLAGLRVLIDGVEVPTSRWSARRKPRTALALLVAGTGSLDRDLLTDALWPGVAMAPATAASRISTVLSVIRSVIGAERRDRPAAPGEERRRGVSLGAYTVELELAACDSTDIAEVRTLAGAVANTPLDQLGRIEELAASLTPYTVGTPLQGLGIEQSIVSAQMGLRDELVAAITSVIGAWLQATADAADHVEPPASVVQLAAAAVRLDPLSEQSTSQQLELFARAGRVVDASRAFHRLRETLDRELGLRPSLELVRHHASIVGGPDDNAS